MRHVTALLCAAAFLVPGPTRAGEGTPHHEHEAPHGGTLVVFGNELAHVELVLDRETGALRAYVLDGDAQRGIPVAQPLLAVDVTPPDGEPFRVGLAAVESVLTGETVGRTSEFVGRSEGLVGLERFDGAIREIDVKGRSFRNVRFGFPEGNEHGGHPAHDGDGGRASSSREEGGA